MSQSPARRRRLELARRFPQARCERCGADLSQIFNVERHLRRCEELAMAQRAAAP